jgi:predicted transcriptional regulator
MASGGDHTTSFIELTANIVSAYVSNNPVPAADIPTLINQIHSALMQVSAGRADVAAEPLRPAVSIKKSITPDHLVCLEDGKKFKSLRRHLRSQYNMTPEQYREKWGLPPDYPMVAPNYAAARSQLAKQMGLGQQREIIACVGNRQACASAARASDRMRSTIDRNPFERCGVRCSRRPICSNSATASVARMLRAGLPE